MWWDEASNNFQGAFPLADLGEPQWPGKTFQEVLAECLVGHVTIGDDHPLVRALLYGR